MVQATPPSAMSDSFNFTLIESAPLAHEALDKLLSAEWLAVDMEFYWRSTYYPELCVLQIADHNQSVVIDTLTPDIKESIASILQKLAQHQCLVFHSGRQDWQIFAQYCGQMPQNVVDIQYTGIYYGLGEHPSLSKLIGHLLKYNKHNSEQCSDWRQRPLTEQQISYARSDVEYISQAYSLLQQQLNAKQWQAVEQDSDDSLLKGQQKTPLEQLGSQFFGYKKLAPMQQLILQELAIWRELKAQQKNRPVRWICSNEMLFSYAKEQNFIENLAKKNTAKGLMRLKSNDKEEIKRLYEEISLFDRETTQLRLFALPDKPMLEMSDERRRIIASVKDHISQIIAENTALSPNIIGKKYLVRFLQEPEANPLMRGWRYYFIGERLLKLCQQDVEDWAQL